MKNLFFATMLLLVLPLHLVAQDDDDMYFVPQKSSKAKRTITVIYDDFDTDDSEGNTDCHVGKLRDIDEYNRRGYGAQGSGKVYGEVYANNDTLYITEQDLQERSRSIYADDDYSCCNRIVRFHGGIRNPYYWDYYYDWAYDPWYYDPWYFGPRYIGWGGPWYYDPWYRHGWIGWHSWGWGGYIGWGGYRPGHHHGYHPGGYYYSSHHYRPGDGIALGRTGGRSMASGSNRFGGISSQRGTHTTQYGSGPSRNTGNRSYVTGTGVRGGGSTTTSRTTGVSSSRGTRSYSTPSSSSSTRSYSTPSSSSGSVRSGSSLGSSSAGGGGFSGGGRGGSSSGGGFGSRGGGRGR